jgi:hypothetical protein
MRAIIGVVLAGLVAGALDTAPVDENSDPPRHDRDFGPGRPQPLLTEEDNRRRDSDQQVPPLKKRQAP